MLLPEFTFGLTKEVTSKCRKIVSQLKKGKNWEDSTACTMIDTNAQEGLLVLNGSSPLLKDSHHFHVYILLDEIFEAWGSQKISHDAYHSYFNACLKTPWGTLSLLSPKNQIWLYPVERHKPFLEATLKFWNIFVDVGCRYTIGSTVGSDLWSVQPNIQYVLFHMGIPQELLQAPLPEGELPYLLKISDIT